MLKQLRSRKLMKRVLRATLFLVIPSFVFFYGWSAMSRGTMPQGEYARVKTGTLSRWSTITPPEIVFATETLANNIRAFLGLSQSRQVDNLIPLKDRIIEAINNRLLLDYARENNVVATRQDIIGLLKQLWPRQTDLYLQAYLRSIRKNQEQFIAEQQRLLTINKAKSLIYAGAKASLFELWQQYLLSEEKIKISYAMMEVKDFLGKVDYSEDELNEFYNNQKDNYRLPNRINYEYIVITLSDLATSVTIKEDEINNYYEEHPEEFTIPRRVKVRHIQLNPPEEQEPEAIEPIRDKIQDIHQQAISGKDFAELADEYSEDPRNIDESTGQKQGGSLGYISKYSEPIWGEEFVEAALSLEKDKISSPVLSRHGFHIIKAEEIVPKKLKPLEEVAEIIDSQLRRAKTQELLTQEATTLAKQAREYTTLSALAKRLNIELKETGVVDEGTYYFPGVGSLYNYKEILDELAKGEMSEVIPLPDSLVIFQIKEKIPSHIPELKIVRQEVIDDLKYEKARERAFQLADEVKQKSETVKDFTQVLQDNALTSNTTDYFTRMQLPEELQGYKKFARTTLRSPQGAIMQGEIEQAGGKIKAYIVWYMAEKQPPKREDFIKDLPRIQRELLQIKQLTLLQEFLSDARNQIKIRINPELIR